MWLTTWRAAFLATVVVEIPIVVAGTRHSGGGLRRRIALAFVAQWLTHPLVWFVSGHCSSLWAIPTLWCTELWAWLVEAGLYALCLPGFAPIRAAGVSALANGASLGFGVLMAACHQR
ncbi:MAG: hypothetical protein M3O50_18255 [Myxococcota bacterium]|nr:hypothetical protein [Myxococcota bacterium]